MRRCCVVQTLMLALALSWTTAWAKTSPLWSTDLDKAFPKSQAAAYLGSGATAELARQEVLPQVSLYLGSRVTSSVDGYRFAQESKCASQGEFCLEYQLRQKVSTESQHTVLGPQFPSEFAAGDGTVSLVAYWYRATASQQFADQIAQLTHQVSSTLASRGCQTSWESWIASLKALLLASQNTDLDRFRQYLTPGTASLVDQSLRTTPENLGSSKERPLAILQVEGEDSTGLSEAFRQTLTQFGLVLVNQAPLSLAARTTYEELPGSDALSKGRGRLELVFNEGPGQLVASTLEARAVGTSPTSARTRSFNYPELKSQCVGWGLYNRPVDGLYDTGRFELLEEKAGLQARIFEFSVFKASTAAAVAARDEAATIVGVQIRLVDTRDGSYVPASGMGQAVTLREGVWAPNMEFDQSTVGIATQNAISDARQSALGRLK